MKKGQFKALRKGQMVIFTRAAMRGYIGSHGKQEMGVVRAYSGPWRSHVWVTIEDHKTAECFAKCFWKAMF